MPFECPLCYKEFRTTSELQRHANKKPVCLIPKLKFDGPLDCTFCGHTYSTTSNLTKHLRKCAIKQNPKALVDCVDRKNQIIEKLRDYVKLLRRKNKECEDRLKELESSETMSESSFETSSGLETEENTSESNSDFESNSDSEYDSDSESQEKKIDLVSTLTTLKFD